MRVQAITIGPHAPRERFNGAVHSIFRNACNVAVDDGGMLTLLAPGMGNAAAGIRLGVPGRFDFADHLQAGQAVGCRAGTIRFLGSALTVDLGGAQPWTPNLPGRGIDMGSREVACAARRAWSVLGRHTGIDGRSGALTEPAGVVCPGSVAADMSPLLCCTRRQLPALLGATRGYDATGAAEAAAPFIGVGPGLTPAGDDFLVGFLGGLWAAAALDRRRPEFIDALGARLAAAAVATTDLSRACLEYAACGTVSERMTEVLCAIGAGDRALAEARVVAALATGHTSGADGILGLLVGLDAWRAERSAAAGMDRLGPALFVGQRVAEEGAAAA